MTESTRIRAASGSCHTAQPRIGVISSVSPPELVAHHAHEAKNRTLPTEHYGFVLLVSSGAGKSICSEYGGSHTLRSACADGPVIDLRRGLPGGRRLLGGGDQPCVICTGPKPIPFLHAALGWPD